MEVERRSPSENRTERMAVPLLFRAGRNVRVPVELSFGWTSNNVVFVVVTANEICWYDSSAGPALIALAKPERVCKVLKFVTAIVLELKLKVGASFTGAIFKEIVASAESKIEFPTVYIT